VLVTYQGEPLKLTNVTIRNLDLPFEYSDGLGWTMFKVPYGTHKILVYHPEYGYKQEVVEVTGNMEVTIDMEGATPEPPEEEGPSGWWGGIIEWFENILKEKKIEPRTTLWLALPILALGIFLILLPKDKKKRKFKYSYLKKKLGG
jgi:hypothetical protein